MSTPSTVVHFVGGTKPGHVAEHIYVNGQEVRVAENGASITYGPAQTTTVTLDLQASEVTFTSTPPDDEVLGDLAESMAERNRQLQDENHALRQSEAEAQFAFEDAKTEVERLTRERDEWMQRYETSHANRLHAERAYEATRTDADGNALVTVRLDDLSGLLRGLLTVGWGPVLDRVRRAVDEREVRDE